MITTIGEFRRLVRAALREGAGAPATKPEPYMRDAFAPDHADREALGYLADVDVDTEDGQLPPHLRDTVEDPEDCFGPVPPDQGDPYVGQDPFVRDSSPLPTPPFKR